MRASLRWPLLLPLLGACAVVAPENRRTLRAMDEHLAPESTALGLAALPVTLPAGLVGLAADAAIMHPVCSLDDAWADTADWLWRTREESRLRQVVMTPLRALVTPFVFAGDWAVRAAFVVPPRREKE
jgi:hypothetical protein